MGRTLLFMLGFFAFTAPALAKDIRTQRWVRISAVRVNGATIEIEGVATDMMHKAIYRQCSAEEGARSFAQKATEFMHQDTVEAKRALYFAVRYSAGGCVETGSFERR